MNQQLNGIGQAGQRGPGRRLRWWTVPVAIVGMFCAAWPVAAWIHRQDPETDQSRRDFMRSKLMYMQNIMEGIATRDFVLIRKGAEEVERITHAGEWLVSDSPEYKHMSDDLRTIAGKLIKAADGKNLDAAALRFSDMTINCMDCHDYSRAHQLY